jgi:hypothetical protein
MNLHLNNYIPGQLRAWNFFPGILILLLCSCTKWTVPSEYVGEWKTGKTKITVRTEPKLMKFQFTSDSANIYIRINSDKTVSGFIGSAAIVNGRLKKNRGLPPSITGVKYIIQCDTIGKIFHTDPLVSKQVEIWLSPLKVSGYMNAELRYREKMAVFPMAGMTFIKVKDQIN